MDPSLCDLPVISSLGGEDLGFPNFKNANWTHFVEKFNEDYLNLYLKMYGNTPNYSWLWIGAGGKI